jgi:erythronate-4-phosphate dehydrogenase
MFETMKFVIDDKIPYIGGVLEKFGEVVYCSGAATTPAVVRDADALVTRTRTICNAQLLGGSRVKFIATATIGYDHIDVDYCRSAGIAWANAPGCNSKSVEQYIAAALLHIAVKRGRPLREQTLGVVGVGHVGAKVATIARKLDMNVLLNDPPRMDMRQVPDAELPDFVPLNKIASHADIITFHVPLEKSGNYATWHAMNAQFFQRLARKPVVINSCRGPVMDTQAVKNAVKNGQISGLVIDCWENEPDIDRELLSMTDIATPHIAGYSRDGKANGTAMSIHALSRFFGLGLEKWYPESIAPPSIPLIELDGNGLTNEQMIEYAVRSSYNIMQDDHALRTAPQLFEKLRGDYPPRREFPAFTVNCHNVPAKVCETLAEIGFMVG